jgi:hypothetical protein
MDISCRRRRYCGFHIAGVEEFRQAEKRGAFASRLKEARDGIR